jgi:hypothetical protein
MRAAFDLFLAQERKPAFDEVQPGRAGGREMEMKPRMANEPPAHARGLVGAVIVENEMHREVGWHLRVDGLKEFEKLLHCFSPRASTVRTAPPLRAAATGQLFEKEWLPDSEWR